MKYLKNSSQPYIVQKYGGFFLANTNRIKSVALKIIQKHQQGYKVIVVISAIQEETNNLLDLAKKCSSIPNKKYTDMLLSCGEQKAISLLAIVLKSLNQKVIALNAFQANIQTKGKHLNSHIVDMDFNKIKKLSKNNIVLITGFQGINKDKEITTLGRGGSDTTAVFIASHFKCPCELFKDVGGLYTIDPKIHKQPKQLKIINYNDALSLSLCGAKVLASSAIKIAKKSKTPIKVLSYKTKSGTQINFNSPTKKIVGFGITNSLKDCIQINIAGNIKEILKAKELLAQNQILINKTKTYKHRVSYIINAKDLYKSTNLICNFFNL